MTKHCESCTCQTPKITCGRCKQDYAPIRPGRPPAMCYTCADSIRAMKHVPALSGLSVSETRIVTWNRNPHTGEDHSTYGRLNSYANRHSWRIVIEPKPDGLHVTRLA